MQSDAELIQLSRRGNPQAFAKLVKRYEQIVKKTTFSMCGNETGKDVAQEVFIRFYNNLAQFQGDAKLSTYITRIAINLSLNELDRSKRKMVNEAQYFKAENPLSKVEKGHQFETNEIVERALAMLEPDFRSVVVLRLIDGYSVQETADMLGLPKGTIASRLNRAQLKLREMIQKLNQNKRI